MNNYSSNHPNLDATRTSEAPLESWKEIGLYLQRDITTVRRWEKNEGLPVHRHSHTSRSSVYAYPSEIDAWRASRRVIAEPPPPVPLWRGLFAWPRAVAFGVTMLACLMMVGNGIRPASAQSRRAPAKRLLCAACGDSEASFSRDGRWMMFEDGDTGDIAIRDMPTGKIKRLRAKSGTWNDAGTYGETPALSPDLRQIIYQWEIDDTEQHVQLRIMPNEPGGMSRVLIDSPQNLDYALAAWFPDGKSVLAILTRIQEGTAQLVRVTVSDGTVKVLKALGWRLNSSDRPSISPDGQNIAYSALAVNPSKPAPAPSDSKDRHIYVLTADGSSETEIVKTSGINQDPVWTPDGKHILFTSDRSGKIDLWSIAVQRGKVAGVASLVSPDIGDVRAMGIYGGAYYMCPRQPQGVEYIHIVETVPGGNKQGNSTHETASFVGVAPTWSPDGKSIAFKRHHPGSVDRYDLVVHSLETGNERTYLTNLGTTGNGAPIWFHGGASIMTGIRRADGSGPAYSIDVKTGDFKELPRIHGWSAVSPDNKTVYYVRRAEPSRVVSVGLDTGQEQPIFVSPKGTGISIALSPDGRTLALALTRALVGSGVNLELARVSVDGSGFREFYTRPPDHRAGIGHVAWSSDGRSILFDQRQPGGDWGVMRISAEGAGPASLVIAAHLGQGRNGGLSFDPSPDGSYFAFTSSERVTALWALDNVLSALK